MVVWAVGRDANAGGDPHSPFEPRMFRIGLRVWMPEEIEGEGETGLGIEDKGGEEKIPRPMRSKLVLLLDATRLPGLGFDAIVHQFRSANMGWTASHGFAAALH